MNTEDKVMAIAVFMYCAVIAGYVGFWGFMAYLAYKLVRHFIG